MTALGIGTSGSALGAIAIPIQTRAMLARVGFAWTVRTSALICAALLLAANVLLRTRLPPKRDGRIFDFGILSRDRAFRIYCVSNIFAFLGMCAAALRPRNMSHREAAIPHSSCWRDSPSMPASMPISHFTASPSLRQAALLVVCYLSVRSAARLEGET